MGHANYRKTERRTHFRIIYTPRKRPVLKIREERFEVVDISESGIRALNRNSRALGGNWIRLTAEFPDGQHMDLVGRIVWTRGDEFGLHLKNFFPTPLIDREKQRRA